MRYGWMIVVCCLFWTGCETVREGAQKVGEPVGGTMKAVGGVTEGAVQGYTDGEKDNPYHR